MSRNQRNGNGRRNSVNNGNCRRNGCSNVSPAQDDVRTVTEPTETIVNTTTNEHVVRYVHPTNVVNVNRDVYRNEHYYPTTEREVNKTVVENYNCGSDLNNPSCRPSRPCRRRNR
ncbi:MAG: CotD family spore coat protein [Bacillus sp. (in: firmicutes)]